MQEKLNKILTSKGKLNHPPYNDNTPNEVLFTHNQYNLPASLLRVIANTCP